MSVFSSILQRWGLVAHDGRPLWKYKVSDSEYERLRMFVRQGLQNGNLLDSPEEVALFVAEWWAREYRGGKTSWEMILGGLGRPYSPEDSELFQNTAKRAIRKGFIPLVRRKNAHYLRSLLVQGGLPLLRMGGDMSNFTRYVTTLSRRIQKYGLEQVIWSQEDGPEISYLPHTFRNGAILQLSLDIAMALIHDDPQELPFAMEGEAANRLWKTLKAENLNNRQKFMGVRLQWFLVLSRYETAETAFLKVRAMVDEEIPLHTQEEYGWQDARRLSVYMDGREIAQYRKNSAGMLMLQSSSSLPRIADAEFELDCYCVGDGAERMPFPCHSVIPDLSSPVLCSLLSEHDGDRVFEVLDRSSMPAETGFVWCPEGWRTDDGSGENVIAVPDWLGHSGLLQSFQESIVLHGDDVRTYRTGIENSPDLAVVAKRLSGVLRTDRNVILGEPKFLLDDTWVAGKDVQWKQAGEKEWHAGNILPPLGSLVYCITTRNDIQYYKCFRLPEQFSIKSRAESERVGQIEMSGTELLVESVPAASISGQGALRILRYEVSDVPKYIRLNVELRSGGRFSCDVSPPFSGATFVDRAGNSLDNHAVLCPSQLEGYRLRCAGEGNVLTISGDNFCHLKPQKRIDLQDGERSLVEFKEDIERILSLASSMDGLVKMEVIGPSGFSRAKLHFRAFNAFIPRAHTDGGPLQVVDPGCHTWKSPVELKALRVCASVADIASVCLAPVAGGYELPAQTPSGNWIVFSEMTPEFSLRPYLHVHIGNAEGTTDVSDLGTAFAEIDRETRQKSIREALLLDVDIQSAQWKAVCAYASLCMAQGIPCDALDVFPVVFSEPDLAASFFFAMQFQLDESEYVPFSLRFVRCLNFSWRMVPITSWNLALGKMESLGLHGLLVQKMRERFFGFMQELFGEHVNAIFMVFSASPTKHPGTIPGAWADELARRISLPENWPQWHPVIDERWRSVLPVKGVDKVRWSLYLAPVQAALHFAGLVAEYWKKPSGWEMRRLRYYRDLDRIWFDQVFAHILKILSSQNEVLR